MGDAADRARRLAAPSARRGISEPSLQHGRRVDHDVDGVRQDAFGAHVAFRQVFAANRSAWPFYGCRSAQVVFNPANRAA
jgi:hypothetical protein